jgi:hypothetical protein
MEGYVYVLTNPAMPGLVKIGRTSRLSDNRVAELSAATGVPAAFEVFFELQVDNCEAAERAVHEELATCRFRGEREFFRVAPDAAASAVVRVCRTWALAPYTGSPDEPAEHRGDGRIGKGWFTCPSCGVPVRVVVPAARCVNGHLLRPGDPTQVLGRRSVHCPTCDLEMSVLNGRGVCALGHALNLFPIEYALPDF